jgi:hypothetical protein
MKFGLQLQKQKYSVKPDFATVTGIYKDSWFGTSQSLRKESYSLNQAFLTTKRIFFYKEGNYVVKWDNAYLHAHLFFLNLITLEKQAH